jgi:long-chain acyl-CoA synthetase
MAVLTTQRATDTPDDLALADDHDRSTWAELDERINRLVHAMRSVGLGHGDTIAILATNSNAWFELAFACTHAGITYVPVNWHLVGPEIAYILADSDSKAVFFDAAMADRMTEALSSPDVGEMAAVVMIGGAGPADRTATVAYEDFVERGDPAEPADQSMGGPMFYTSGTTGNPKGVRSSLSTTPPGTDPTMLKGPASAYGDMVVEGGRTALCGPVYHSAQWAFSFLPMVLGASTVMQSKYDSAALLDLIDTHQVTHVHLVPTQMKRLLDLPDDVKQSFGGASLERVLHGAAPCPPAVKRGLIEWWGPKIMEYYGSTEASIVSTVGSEDWLRKGGSVGTPKPGIEIHVLDERGEPVEVGQSGTLYFKTGRSFEYNKAPGKTAENRTANGLFTTGDVGYFDDEGFLWLSDRKIDMIISGGVNIYPAETEGVLGGHPDVADVAVIGVPNEEFGEEVKAIVVPSAGVDVATLADTLDALCRTHLAGFKRPKSYEFRDELPRTGTGKVQKAKLRAPFWVGEDRPI